MDAAAAGIDRHVTSVLLGKHRFVAHCDAIKRYLLLCQARAHRLPGRACAARRAERPGALAGPSAPARPPLPGPSWRAAGRAWQRPVRHPRVAALAEPHRAAGPAA